MRAARILLLAAAVATGAAAIYLAASVPSEPATVRLPLDADDRALLALVPADAKAFAFVPSAAALHRRLLAHPVTQRGFERWTGRQNLPRPWMIGNGDLVAWQSGDGVHYALRVDALRAFLVRVYLQWSGKEGSREGRVFIVGERGGPRIGRAELDALSSLASGLPAAHALLIQREGGTFPPIARPAATAVTVSEREIFLASRAATADGAVPKPAPSIRFPRSALVTAWFSEPPRAIDDLDRLLRARVSALLRDGGAIALYGVESGTLMPRPREVFILPAAEDRRRLLDEFVRGLAPQTLRDALGLRLETADTGSELLVAFDRTSIGKYRADVLVEPRFPGAAWSLRLDVAGARPALDRVVDSPALRFATPRLHRSARNLARWLGGLEGAATIEAAVFKRPEGEELRVVISPK
ncbi:MAG TPA: hypothetical protein VNL91_10900 [Thermoanaerobaculia bacterium]|nr:hypothetical protein [Thermoanaerobaculia bacterium]